MRGVVLNQDRGVFAHAFAVYGPDGRIVGEESKGKLLGRLKDKKRIPVFWRVRFNYWDDEVNEERLKIASIHEDYLTMKGVKQPPPPSFNIGTRVKAMGFAKPEQPPPNPNLPQSLRALLHA